MTVVIITYDAKCKHCCMLKEFRMGKRKLHYCDNKESIHYSQKRAKKELACEKFKLNP